VTATVVALLAGVVGGELGTDDGGVEPDVVGGEFGDEPDVGGDEPDVVGGGDEPDVVGGGGVEEPPQLAQKAPARKVGS